MRPQVLTCTPDTPLITAAQRMAGEPIHALAQQTDRLTEGPTHRAGRPDGRHAVSHALIVDPRTDRPVGDVSTLDIAGILTWSRA